MSLLSAYKNIVSRVYRLSQLSYQHQDTSEEFDEFLEQLQKALEANTQESYIPPHVEIKDIPPENIVVVKDDTVKNISIRHIGPQDINELIQESEITEIEADDDKEIAATAIETTLDEPFMIRPDGDEITDGDTYVSDDEDDDNDDKDLDIQEHSGIKYYVSDESKRVYQFIDDHHHGPFIGKLENGKIVLI